MSEIHLSPDAIHARVDDSESYHVGFVVDLFTALPGSNPARVAPDGTIERPIAPDVLSGDLAQKVLDRAGVTFDISPK